MADDRPRTWSQRRIRDWWRDTKKRYPHNARLSDEDLGIFFDLLTRHPRHDAIIGAGVQTVYVLHGGWGGKSTFKLLRVDGKHEGVGINPVALGREYNTCELFTRSCRSAVVPDIVAFKLVAKARGDLMCSICRCELVLDTCQVDHVEPLFKDITDAWLAEYGMVLEDFEGDDVFATDGKGHYFFADDRIAEAFRSFHASVAPRLRLACAPCHAKVSRGAV